jgi:hypothetical protein
MLTEIEKVAGLEFRKEQMARLTRLNEEEPADTMPPVLLHHIRHVCPVLGKSVSFEMREVYVPSPPFLVGLADGDGTLMALEMTEERYAEVAEFTEWTREIMGEELALRLSVVRGLIPSGRFGFIYREGRCADCKLSGRSRKARLVDAAERPPLGRS